MAEKTFKLDIFNLMSRLDSGEKDIWNTLTDDEKKGFSALIIMRWMSGCTDFRQIMYLNTFVNETLFTLSKHPELLMQLLSVSSSKTPKRYQWIGVKGNKKNKNELKVQVISEYYGYTNREARHALPLLTNEDILEYAGELGYQKEQIQMLKKELNV